jgi:hypothetical protein
MHTAADEGARLLPHMHMARELAKKPVSSLSLNLPHALNVGDSERR